MKNTKTKPLFLFFIIMAIAIFFRFYKLTEIPPGLYPDVAINGNDALESLRTSEFEVFYRENNGREGLFINLIALSFYLFGASVWAIKVVPAIIGVLTVLGMFLMVKELFHKVANQQSQISSQAQNIALLSSFFLAISFWHVNFSRLGFRAIMVPFILVWGFYFLFKATQMIRITHRDDKDFKIKKLVASGYWLISGLVFGLGFHTYISYRVALIIIIIPFLIEIYNFWQKQKQNIVDNKLCVHFWGIFFVALIIAASPMITYFYKNPQDFMGRTGQVSVLASKTPIKDITISFIKSIGMFNISGDCNWRHNYNCQPALPLPIGIMFITGIAWSIYQIWTSARKRAHWRRLSPAIPDTNIAEKANTTSRIPQADSIIENKSDNSWSFSQVALFLFVWFFVMLLPEILTNEGLPHSLRSIGAIPVVYIFAGFGGWWIINKLKTNSKKQKAALIILGIIFCLWLILYSYNLYFIQWGQNPETKGAFTQNLVDIGNYLNSLPDEGVKKYVVVNEGGVPVPYPNGIPMPAQTIMFIEQTKPHQRQTHYLIPDELVNFHGLNAKANYSLVFVLMRYDENVLNELKNRAPNGIIKQEESNIWTFQIKN